jgi:hypothetical protein
MQDKQDELFQLIAWIDKNTAGLSFDTDERTLLALGCLDAALEYQAAIAMLAGSSLYGAAFALLRILAESLIRGLWLYSCATESEIKRFQTGKLKKSIATLISEYETKIGTPSGTLSNFKDTAWSALNGFTHTGIHQVSRRHNADKLEGNYSDVEIAKALGVAGALGMIAAGQLIAMSGHEQLIAKYLERTNQYALSKN